jgi:hypothetical protein
MQLRWVIWARGEDPDVNVAILNVGDPDLAQEVQTVCGLPDTHGDEVGWPKGCQLLVADAGGAVEVFGLMLCDNGSASTPDDCCEAAASQRWKSHTALLVPLMDELLLELMLDFLEGLDGFLLGLVDFAQVDCVGGCLANLSTTASWD